MLDLLKNSAEMTTTENGAATHSTSGDRCLDLFFRAGAFRYTCEEEICKTVLRAFCEDPLTALRTLFYARDVRGGLGERRFFRIAVRYLARSFPEVIKRNIALFPVYGRYDDLLCLLDSPCEDEAVSFISGLLSADVSAMKKGRSVSLLAKWLPSVNASSAGTRITARKLAGCLGMSERRYRRTLSALRRNIHIIENDLRLRDYSFDYQAVPSGAMFKYISAFQRNDRERFGQYLEMVENGNAKLNATVLYPYQIVRRCLEGVNEAERRAVNDVWNSLPQLNNENSRAIAVVDGSGSMTCSMGSLRPIDAALSLGIYFAEQNKGAFANHFITFSHTPQLVEIKGGDICSKVVYCASYNEIANTNIEAVFRLILDTAAANNLPAEELPERLYIISDMEFDRCVTGDDGFTGGDLTPVYEQMKAEYARYGYHLPQVVFWNVAARNANYPIRSDENGTALVSGFSTAVFDMLTEGQISPKYIMDKVLNSPRYAAVSA